KVPVRVHSDLRSDRREENADPTQAGANLLAFIRSDFPMEEAMVQAIPMRSKGGADSGYEVALDSGRYQARVARIPNLYVASAKSGSTNLLKEELIVTGASSVDAIEIELKDD